MVSVDHDAKAVLEDDTAVWTSSPEERATEAMGSDVEGERTGRYLEIMGGTGLPEIILLIFGSCLDIIALLCFDIPYLNISKSLIFALDVRILLFMALFLITEK
jgi:hypothetical protein